MRIGLLIATSACAMPPIEAPRAPDEIVIVGEDGAPVAGARVEWTDGEMPCDVETPMPDVYVWQGRETADDEGRVTVAHPGRHVVRVVAGDRAALARIDEVDRSITLHPIAAIAFAPTCGGGGACDALEAYGAMTSGGATCRIVGARAIRAPRGTLSLAITAARDRPGEAFAQIDATIDRDTTIAPAMARTGGDETLRGRVVLPGGRAPGEPTYATHVAVRCGRHLARDVDVAADGHFEVRALPARECTLRATHDDDDRYEQTLDVTPGRDHDVTIELERAW